MIHLITLTRKTFYRQQTVIDEAHGVDCYTDFFKLRIAGGQSKNKCLTNKDRS